MKSTPKKKLVLITRPTADADVFAAEMTTLGFTPFIEPMLGIIPTPYKAPDFKNYPAIVFTSANAVRVAGCPADNRDIAVFAVGAHTADEARKQGYLRVFSTEGDGADLGALIRKKLVGAEQKILHIRGEHVAVPLEDILLKDRIKTDALVVYTAKTEDNFTFACRAALEKGDIAAVTFFSKRTAENFVRLIKKEDLGVALKPIKALCISQAVLECVQSASPGLVWGGAYSAERPDRPAMLDLLKAAI